MPSLTVFFQLLFVGAVSLKQDAEGIPLFQTGGRSDDKDNQGKELNKHLRFRFRSYFVSWLLCNHKQFMKQLSKATKEGSKNNNMEKLHHR